MMSKFQQTPDMHVIMILIIVNFMNAKKIYNESIICPVSFLFLNMIEKFILYYR